MVRRLSETYAAGDRVEIWLAGRWQPGTVAGAAHPGLWVESGGQRWFVTNRRHIRPSGTGRPSTAEPGQR
jgi:hypothetical protein